MRDRAVCPERRASHLEVKCPEKHWSLHRRKETTMSLESPLPLTPEESKILMSLFNQHWDHARHCDTIRSAMLAAFGALFAAVTWQPTAQTQSAWPLGLLASLSALGLLLSVKTSYLFRLHTKLAQAKLNRLPGAVVFIPYCEEGLFDQKWLSVSFLIGTAYGVLSAFAAGRWLSVWLHLTGWVGGVALGSGVIIAALFGLWCLREASASQVERILVASASQLPG